MFCGISLMLMRNGKIPFVQEVQKNLREIANLPALRQMWALRKFYGNLPPTDPRILSMTPEQVELEFMHMVLDAEAKDGKVYTDPEYDKYDEETEIEDNPERSESLLPSDDWVDVEIDDLEE